MNIFLDTNNEYKKDYSATRMICIILQAFNYKAVLAGGCVRDFIQEVEYNDIDIATDAQPDEVIKLLTDFGIEVKEVGKSFGVVLARHEGFEFEIATFRHDINCDGRHPSSVEFCSMEEDARRRDFTMNAIFYDPISDDIYDFVGGVKDIENKILRFVGNTQQRLEEDYLRALRYVRFACKGYELVDNERTIVNSSLLSVLEKVSKERIVLEFRKIFARNSLFTIYAFIDLVNGFDNLIPVFFPQIEKLKNIEQNPLYHPEGSAYNHTILVWNYLNGKNASFLCQLAGLFHDTGKAYCTKIEDNKIISHGHELVSRDTVETWMQEYKFSTSDIEYVSGIVADHMKLHNRGMSKAILRKLIAQPYFDDLVLHCEADIASSDQDFSILNEYKARIEEIKKEPILPMKFITGSDLISQGLKPSELFGKIISDIYDLQLEGKLKTKEEALCFLDNYLLEVDR